MPRQLSPVDTAFLLAERRHQPFHVGALCLYEPPDRDGNGVALEIAERLRQSQRATPPFNRRLLPRRFGLNDWEEAEDFDLAQHFVHLSLPRPGRIRELLAMVSRMHSAHLDRAYPLWRLYLIEGLEDGRIATFSKIHHALVDGIAGIRLMLRSMSSDPASSRSMPPPWEMSPGCERALGHPPQLPQDVLRLAQAVARATPAWWRHVSRTLLDYRAHHPDAVNSLQAPHCMLNAPVSGSRRFSAQSYSTARVRRLAAVFDASCNDILLALCGAALRRYLLIRRALPERPLVAGVPVSIRRDDSTSGNEIAFALASLATHQADPVRRVEIVKGSMDYNKQMFRDMSSAQILAYSLTLLAPGALTLLPGLNRHHTPLNVIISNVPGPREDMYWQGCRLSGIYPASIVLDGFALNITLISRHDAIDFGITACRRSLPQAQSLLGYIEDALLELEQACDLPPADEPFTAARLDGPG